MTVSVSTADHVFCDSDAVIDIAKAGGAVCDAFLRFIGDRGHLVEDVLNELEGWAQSREPYARSLGEMLGSWSAAEEERVHELSDAQRDDVAAILDFDVEDVAADAFVPDKGETATVVYCREWIAQTPSDETVIAMTDYKGTKRAQANGIDCCAFRELCQAMEDGGYITSPQHQHALRQKYPDPARR